MNRYSYMTRGHEWLHCCRFGIHLFLCLHPDGFWNPTSLMSNAYGDSCGGTVVWTYSRLQMTKFRRKTRIYLHSLIRISGVVFNQAWTTLDTALQRRRIFAKLRKLWSDGDKKQISWGWVQISAKLQYLVVFLTFFT